jgi:glutaredoxin
MFKKLLLAITLLFVSVLPVFAHKGDQEHVVDDKPVYFVRAGCPHCAKVDAFMEEYDLTDQVERVETYNDNENIALMEEWFDHFDLPEAQRGVPFLVVDDETYYAGDSPIIQYMADQNDIEVKAEEYQSSMSDTAVLLLGGIFLAGVLGYGVYSMLRKK